MQGDTLSRRRFFSVAGLGTASVLGAYAASSVISKLPPVLGGPTSKLTSSPAAQGPYLTSRLIIGDGSGGITAMPNPYTLSQIPQRDFENPDFNTSCVNNQLIPNTDLPTHVLAAVYYPSGKISGIRDHRVPTPNPLNLLKGPYPLVLYAHGYRSPGTGCLVASPLNQDFTTVDTMMQHVASYGCVCVVPDLSWLPGGFPTTDPAYQDAFQLRAAVLVAYYNYLAQLNAPLFAQQLDLSRVVLIGHSTGGGAATQAGHDLSAMVSLRSLAYGLIGPIPIPGIASADLRNLLVLKGTNDTTQGANPQAAYAASGAPKTLVTIPGANHFGYTDLCDANNTCVPYGINDPQGAISRADQQLAGASYLAALVRYYALGDATARPYLTGKQMEGLESLNIQVQSAGYIPIPPIAPTQPAQS